MARKEKLYHFIYKTTNVLNGNYYYGMHSTDNLNDGYYGSGRRLKRSLNKYGKENHKVEIIEFLENRNLLISREKIIVSLNEISKKECMNLMVGGVGGFISDEQQRHRSICAVNALIKKMKTNPEFRKNVCEKLKSSTKKKWENGDYDNRINIGFKDKKHTEETKIKMSIMKKGKYIGKLNSQYNTCWITNGVNNKKIKKNEIQIYVNSNWKLGRCNLKKQQ